MTREQVIGAGVTPAIAEAVCAFLKCNIPTPQFAADATYLINSEGKMVGWLNAADMIKSLGIPLPKDDQPDLPLYSDPNLNRK